MSSKTAAQQQRDCHIVPDDDGFSLTRFIRGQDRMYPDLRFTFRPVMPLMRARILERRSELGEEEAVLAFAKVIEKQLIEWNAVGPDGKALPIKLDSISKLHPTLMGRVFGIVIFSNEGGDVDPLQSRFTEQTKEIPDLMADKKGSGGLVEESQKN